MRITRKSNNPYKESFIAGSKKETFIKAAYLAIITYLLYVLILILGKGL